MSQEWAVHFEADYHSEADLDRVVDDLLEALRPWHASAIGTSGTPTGTSVRVGGTITVAGPDIRLALRKAVRIIHHALLEIGLPSPWKVTRLEIMSVEEQECELARSNAPELVGLSELAAILGVSKQRVSELRRLDGFPHPLAQLAAGPVWARPMIQRFIDQWPRRPGRPRKVAADESGVNLVAEPGDPGEARSSHGKDLGRAG